MLPDAPMYKITAPYCTFSCICNDVDFPMYETRVNSQHNPQIGMISKRWWGRVMWMNASMSILQVSGELFVMITQWCDDCKFKQQFAPFILQRKWLIITNKVFKRQWHHYRWWTVKALICSPIQKSPLPWEYLCVVLCDSQIDMNHNFCHLRWPRVRHVHRWEQVDPHSVPVDLTGVHR